MELKLVRDRFSKNSTTGKLFVDAEFECFTLEDVDRGLSQAMPLAEIKAKKIYGQTAIPKGRYRVTTSESGLFHRVMPLLLDVPAYEYVRIHPGNSKEDTLGCILLGEARTVDWVNNSKKAFEKFYTKMQAALKRGEKVFITIE